MNSGKEAEKEGSRVGRWREEKMQFGMGECGKKGERRRGKGDRPTTTGEKGRRASVAHANNRGGESEPVAGAEAGEGKTAGKEAGAEVGEGEGRPLEENREREKERLSCAGPKATFPPAQQFGGVNEGPVADYVTENRATYREPTIAGFSNFLFRLCFYNTTPDGHAFTIRMGSRQGENIMLWVWDANRNSPVNDKHPPPATLLVGQSLRMAGASKLVSLTSLEDGSDWALTA
ncbi:hypothetical protein ACLOJK_008806 [Asimina triloba]